MSKPQFVYVIYISTTPELLFNALIDEKMTRQYWLHRNVSDWKPGSRWEHRRTDEANTLNLAGKVLESDPPRRLVISWAYPSDENTPEKTSRVTFTIEPVPGAAASKLTVTHDDLQPDSKMLEGITAGWPKVLSGLKTLLETGKATPFIAIK